MGRCRDAVAWGRQAPLLLGDTPGFLLLLLVLEACAILDGHHHFRGALAESFEAEVLDELGEWQFPPLLLMVVELAHFRRVHAQLSRHLDLGVRQAVAMACIDPRLQLRG